MLLQLWGLVASMSLASGAQGAVRTTPKGSASRSGPFEESSSCRVTAAGGASAAIGEPRIVPLGVDEAANRRHLGWGAPIAVSPDRRWVAYTVTAPARISGLSATDPDATNSGVPTFVRGSELWVCDLRSGASYSLNTDASVSWGGVWSPDARRLAFYSDRDGRQRLWVWNASTRLVRRVSNAVVKSFYPFELAAWVPDGRSLVVKLAAAGDGSPPDATGDSAAVLGMRAYRSDGPGTPAQMERDAERRHGADSMAAVRRYLGDLAVVSMATGRAKRLVRRQAIASYFVSPTGDAVAYVVVHGFDALNSQDNRVDINTVQLAQGRVTSVAADVQQSLTGLSVSWAPNGRWLAYYVTTLSHSSSGDCYVAPVGGGAAVDVTPGPHPDFVMIFGGRCGILAATPCTSWARTPFGG